MFMLKVLLKSKTGGYLMFFVFSLICGAIGEMYFPSGAFSNFNGIVSWILFTVMGLFYAFILWVGYSVITSLFSAMTEDLKETAQQLRNKEK